MLHRLVHTRHDRVISLLRIVLAAVIFPHGAQKVLGWFGGFGYAGTMNMLTEGMGIPAFFAFLAIVAEFAGSLGLLVGLLSRVAAFGIACNMAVAMAMVHLPIGFFMNWTGQQGGEGFEFHLLVLGMCLAVMIRGGGAASLDLKLTESLEKTRPEGRSGLRRVA